MAEELSSGLASILCCIDGHNAVELKYGAFSKPWGLGVRTCAGEILGSVKIR